MHRASDPFSLQLVEDLVAPDAQPIEMKTDREHVPGMDPIRGVLMKPALKHLFYGINFTPFIEEAERRAKTAVV